MLARAGVHAHWVLQCIVAIANATLLATACQRCHSSTEVNLSPLQDTPYAVFGLGNKTYEHFNAMGKHVHKHLERLGGNPILPVGLGDDDADIADDFEVWCEALLKAVDATALLHQSSAARTSDVRAKRGYTVRLHPQDALASGTRAGAQPPAPWVGAVEKHVPAVARVAAVRELHSAQSERSCVHAEVDLKGAPFA